MTDDFSGLEAIGGALRPSIVILGQAAQSLASGDEPPAIAARQADRSCGTFTLQEGRMGNRPGGELAKRPLHFFWLADCSGSMSVDEKVQSLNHAIREAIPEMRRVAAENPNAEVLVRSLRFATGAQWHVSVPTPIESFEWQDLDAEGSTDLGHALALLTSQLKTPPMAQRALPPIVVLLSDGFPTDEYGPALDALLAEPWGKKAVRIAIAIGKDANLSVLERFIGNPEVKPLTARNPGQLVRFIRWASTAVLKSASAPASQALGALPGNVPIPPPPPDNAPSAAEDVW